ncbi:alkaline phosphatase family protein [Myxococcota bacterium]|nr:alkaline phosphatase family protein [Myxococcota bacterium]
MSSASPARNLRVVLVVLDAFAHRFVHPERTPNLWALRDEGGWAPSGGRSVLSASTYPNHATFATGTDPATHRILTGNVLVDGAFHPADEVGPACPTLFTRMRDAGRRAVAVFGDQKLVGVCGAREAAVHWPPDGVLPEGTPTGAFGYGADRAVVSALDTVEPERAELLVVQLDETDTARHLYGPDATEALEQAHATDAALGEVMERLRAHWSDTVVMVVSDHDNEAVSKGAVDLAAEASERGLDVLVDHDGTAALVVGDVARGDLLALPGVADAAALAPEHWLVWGEVGQQFGADWGLKGQHGSPRTAEQLAVVGGGHPEVAGLARRIAATPPPARAWAGFACELLGLDRPAA